MSLTLSPLNIMKIKQLLLNQGLVVEFILSLLQNFQHGEKKREREERIK